MRADATGAMSERRPSEKKSLPGRGEESHAASADNEMKKTRLSARVKLRDEDDKIYGERFVASDPPISVSSFRSSAAGECAGRHRDIGETSGGDRNRKQLCDDA